MRFGKFAVSIVAVALLFFAATYYNKIKKFGGLEKAPNNPVVEITVNNEKNVILKCLPFTVFGDFRFNIDAVSDVLKDAQNFNPVFMINTGGMLAVPDSENLSVYLNTLNKIWNKTTPFYHTPGKSELNYVFTGSDAAQFKKIFGKTEYYADLYNWRFIFFDTSKSDAGGDTYKWLKKLVKNSKNMNLVLVTYCPPQGASMENSECVLNSGFSDDLADILKLGNIKAILTGGGVGSRVYYFFDTPVYVTSFNKNAYSEKNPAEYNYGQICGDNLIIKKRTLYPDGTSKLLNYGN